MLTMTRPASSESDTVMSPPGGVNFDGTLEDILQDQGFRTDLHLLAAILLGERLRPLLERLLSLRPLEGDR
jgi:hypothetical protein